MASTGTAGGGCDRRVRAETNAIIADQKRKEHADLLLLVVRAAGRASFSCRSAAAPSSPPMPIDSTAELGTSISAPFSFRPS